MGSIKKKLTKLVPEYSPDSTVETDTLSELARKDLRLNKQ